VVDETQKIESEGSNQVHTYMFICTDDVICIDMYDYMFMWLLMVVSVYVFVCIYQILYVYLSICINLTIYDQFMFVYIGFSFMF
jgi:hypothetical protein